MAMSLPVLIITIIIAYLLGSINFAIVLSSLFKLNDPRHYGSGNPGATNVLRTQHKTAAVAILLADILKGLVAVIIGHFFAIHGFNLGLVAMAAVLGHIYPLFFKFKGGKGVATMIGVLLGLNLLLGVVAIIIWIAVAFVFRYSSLASLSMAITAPVITLFIASPVYFMPLMVLTLFIVYRHRANINRLWHRQEKKISFLATSGKRR